MTEGLIRIWEKRAKSFEDSRDWHSARVIEDCIADLRRQCLTPGSSLLADLERLRADTDDTHNGKLIYGMVGDCIGLVKKHLALKSSHGSVVAGAAQGNCSLASAVETDPTAPAPTTDTIRNAHPAIQQVYEFGCQSLSPDVFDGFLRGLLDICTRQEEGRKIRAERGEAEPASMPDEAALASRIRDHVWQFTRGNAGVTSITSEIMKTIRLYLAHKPEAVQPVEERFGGRLDLVPEWLAKACEAVRLEQKQTSVIEYNAATAIREYLRHLMPNGRCPITPQTLQSHQELFDLGVEHASKPERESVDQWRPMSEHPPEGQPVIAKTRHGAVGIAYVYKLDTETPQWNFMAMGQNAMGLWDAEAKWMPLPEEKARRS